MDSYKPEDAHQLLLKGHIKEMHVRLERMVAMDQRKYSFSMGGTESLAFVQLWNGYPMPVYQAIAINYVLGKIDHKAKSPAYVN